MGEPSPNRVWAKARLQSDPQRLNAGMTPSFTRWNCSIMTACGVVKAVEKLRPYYEEHVKMFAPLGFVPGITPAQVEAVGRRGGWDKAGVPTLEHYMKLGSWFAGTAPQLVEHLKGMEARFPGLETINLSTALTTPQAVMLDQFQRVKEGVMPAFGKR